MAKPVTASLASLGAGYNPLPQNNTVTRKRKEMHQPTQAPSTPPRPSRSSAPSALTSPQQADSPMRYHFSDGMEAMKNRDIKKLEKKPQHTLAPPSAEDPLKIASRHWTKIKEARKQLTDKETEIDIHVRNATLTVSSDGVLVSTATKVQKVDFHIVQRKDGPGVRPFPKESLNGNPSFTLEGSVFSEALNDFRNTPTPPGRSQSPFYDFFKDEWYPQNYGRLNSSPSSSSTSSSSSPTSSPSPSPTPEPSEPAKKKARKEPHQEPPLPLTGKPPAIASPVKAEKPRPNKHVIFRA